MSNGEITCVNTLDGVHAAPNPYITALNEFMDATNMRRLQIDDLHT